MWESYASRLHVSQTPDILWLLAHLSLDRNGYVTTHHFILLDELVQMTEEDMDSVLSFYESGKIPALEEVRNKYGILPDS
jgi:hypothetical protein